MSDKSLDDVIGGFELGGASAEMGEDRKPITIWVHKDYKTDYDDLQRKSNGQFCKTLRQIFMLSIDKAKSKVG